MSALRIAVIGVGAYKDSRARSYIRTVKKLSDIYFLCALCDRDGGALREAGSAFGVRALYTDVEKMLDEERPDVAFVLVPTDGQSAVALTAARRGCNIITEIPFAITLPLGDAVAKACSDNGVKWEVAENVWLWPHERLKRMIVDSGVLGKITHARLWYTSGPYHGFNAMRTILGREAKRVLGYAQKVDTLPYVSYGGLREESSWWEGGLVEFDGGVACLYEKPPKVGPHGSHWEVEGTKGYLSGNGMRDELVLYEDGGRVRYEFEDSYEQVDGEKVLASVRVKTDRPITWENPFKRYKISDFDDVAKASILSSMHRAVSYRVEPEYGAANARRDLEIWFAIRESARQGSGWVDLPLEGVTELERRIREEYARRYGHDPVEDAQRLLRARFDRLSVTWTLAGFL
ncbi:MAG: Gfo/Idh/MocA family oxidoreductase [Candidatus Brockarchaeota archaeon]|nr:Gfo/Idh/MocA family oxidoreductase [Candidatus Brockarchaeota archaeon]